MSLLLQMFTSYLATFFVITFASVYLIVRYIFTYWKRRGIKYVSPSFPFGNFGLAFMQKLSWAELGSLLYNSTSDPFIGAFSFLRPTLIVRDPHLIRSILVKDFQHFVDRGLYHDEINDPLSAQLFTMGSDKWRNLRVKLTPAFTSGKLKAMFSTLTDCGNILQRHMDHLVESKVNVELRELSARFATNCIASVGFGCDINCIDNPNTSFRKYGRQFFATTLKNGLRFLAMFNFPQILKTFKIRLVDHDIEDFMTTMVKQTMEFREKNNVVRKDYFQLLLQLRNTGNVQLDDEWETVITNDEKGKQLTLTEVTAQAFVFYIAGFETTSATMAYCVYEITRNPDIQKKVHDEIDEVLRKHDGKISYESVSDMKYLECCLDETLRKYPPLPMLNRECTKDYQIPNTDVIIEKGTSITIPIFSIQRDPHYYPEPGKFDPERFMDSAAVSKMPYYPFGEGPRICIGMRLGKMQTKVGILLMMQKYKYELGEQHKREELSFSPAGVILTPKTGIDLKIYAR